MNLDSFPAQLGSRLYFLFLSPSGTGLPLSFFWGHFSLAFSFMESTGRLTLHPAHTSNTERSRTGSCRLLWSSSRSYFSWRSLRAGGASVSLSNYSDHCVPVLVAVGWPCAGKEKPLPVHQKYSVAEEFLRARLLESFCAINGCLS